MDSNHQGKFIVLYGVNNLGKTTQAKMLVQKLKDSGLQAEYLKYPVYDLVPSGQILNNYLRQGNFHNLTPREIQIIYAFNRAQFQEKLREKLSQGINIVAEDYTGTGIAWGLAAGLDENFLKLINSNLLKEDLAFLFDGERFLESIEYNHQHETDSRLITKARIAHLRLGYELGWTLIDANQPVGLIHDKIWNQVLKLLIK
ncbi:MAG: hypothetical protein Q7K35_05920 [bacterium]|nr:hypothetical protein [bacterium]